MVPVLLGVPNLADADVLVLKDGQRFEGIVSEDEEEVSIELGHG